MKASLRRRLDAVELAIPQPVDDDRVELDLSLLSDAQLDTLEELCERRDAWPGGQEDWLAHDLSIADRQHLLDITMTLNGGDRA